MNVKRRKLLNNLICNLYGNLEELRNLYEEENESFENIPENLQNSERYEVAENAVDSLCESVESLEEVINIIEELIL